MNGEGRLWEGMKPGMRGSAGMEWTLSTYEELTTGGILDTGNEELDVTLRHDDTIRGGDRSISGCLVASHGG